MTIDKIFYSESVEATNTSGNKKWFKAGIEVADVNNEATKATTIAKEYVAETLLKSIEANPEYRVDPATFQSNLTYSKPTDLVKKEDKASTFNRLIADINTCTELNVLKSYELLAKNNQAVKEAYELRHNLLTKQLEKQLTYGF